MIITELENGELRLVLQVEKFDYNGAPELAKAFKDRFEDAFETLVIDLAKVRHIDSTAIGALLKIQNALPENRLPVVLRNVRPELICVIELMRLHRVFALEPLQAPA